jgi:hypothetical protein
LILLNTASFISTFSKATLAINKSAHIPRKKDHPILEAPSCIRLNMSCGYSNDDAPAVLYHEAATALFLAIEEMEWRAAFDILQDDPDQVRTWIRSKGSESTTFDWSVWRRLPIHEVGPLRKENMSE